MRFPRDELSCPMEIAFWSTSDLITNLTFFDEPEDNMTTSRLADTGTVAQTQAPNHIMLPLVCALTPSRAYTSRTLMRRSPQAEPHCSSDSHPQSIAWRPRLR